MSAARFPIRALATELDASARRSLANYLRALALGARPTKPPRLTEKLLATPFVTVYGAGGALVGCAGIPGGTTGTRIARATAAAMVDSRFGESARDRDLSAQVAYAVDPQRVTSRELPTVLEAGLHGLATRGPRNEPFIVFPDVAQHHGLDANGLLRALLRKGALEPSDDRPLFYFRTSGAIARSYALPEHGSSTNLAAAWLAGMLTAGSRMVLSAHARTGQASTTGEMYHARIAAAVAALHEHGGFPGQTRRARAALQAEATRALDGTSVTDWPRDVPRLAGTLALLLRAGVQVRAPLVALAPSQELAADPWHAAQVVLALGKDAPEFLFQTCMRALTPGSFHPWTALAAFALGRMEDYERVCNALVAHVREAPPHVGGVSARGSSVPEVALTAIAAEALALAPTARTRSALQRAREFVKDAQLKARSAPVMADPRTCHGAFPASPVNLLLRVDVTGHALSCLLSGRSRD